MGKFRRLRTWLGLMGVLLAVGFFLNHFSPKKDEIPTFTTPDLNERREAGNCDRENGTVMTKVSEPADLSTNKVFPPPEDPEQVKQDGWTQLRQGGAILLGSMFYLQDKSSVQIQTAGNWIVVLDGEGQFIFEDARNDGKGSVRTNYWFVKKGQFRAKPHDYDPAHHFIQIRTATAQVFVDQGEIGLRVAEEGGGQIWLMSGKASVTWKDGRRKDLPLRGMEYL